MSTSAAAEEVTFTILHTNDMHSHLLGHNPNIDYTPNTTNDDETLGGWARLATVINEEKAARTNTVFVMDAGDFLMGTLFHMISRDEAAELTLMKEMGYDFTTLGNHEFDLRPRGLSRILRSAVKKGGMPQILASNTVFDPEDEADDALEEDFEAGLVKRYVVIERDGIKIGLFGIIGTDAAEVAPFASPLSFGDMIETSREMVKLLREEEKVDIVICLSHSGLREDKDRSEDEILAKEVSGIDIIISGHSHTVVPDPILINNTIVVQAGEYGKFIGVLDFTVGDDKKVSLANYKLVSIDDSIKGDERITGLIEERKRIVERDVLTGLGLKFSQTVAETDYDMILKNEEVGIGNMATDAIRWAANKRVYDPADPLSRVRLSIQSNGLIRSNILVGKTGRVCVSDLFRVEPLGIGVDDTMSYPLVTFYLNAQEIKKAMEVPTSIYPIKGSDYYLQVSGLKVTYNPKRMIFDRVTEILIEEEDGSFVPLDYSSKNKELYRITTNYYNASFIKVVGSFTNNILTMVPKDRDGNRIEDLATERIDKDPATPGVQELKDWETIFEYVSTFEDGDGDGIKEISYRYKGAEGRFVPEPSLNPVKLLKRGNYLTWIAFTAVVVVLVIVFLIVYVPVKIVKRRKKK
ncbi:MAG: bifunctional metallophosphatase/5'-nucleotidase [Deltaproteobacteria bacterium]|uniref:Bifunctional metallophosphatase/5'-nucleotidase n=1 Tax=Candidatus Zymogenus saltonus TaxID=2844893 RepID=A0A9D8KHR7_9DELT|nr:bifunctional metallophosphatase/5'-nucleotidase [Candidatus Zymogenus saltonus]